MNLTEFNKSLQNNIIAPVYLFEGPEINLVNRYEKQLKEVVVSPVMEAFNYKKYSQKDCDFNEVIASCETLPVMSDKRLIIIDETTKFSDINDKEFIKSFESYLKSPSPSTVLLIRIPKIDKRKKIYTLLKKYGKIVEFKKLDRKELNSFITKVLKEQKISMTDQVKNFYIDRTHYLDNDDIDTFSIENQLKQLANYTDETGKITIDMVKEVVPEGIEDNIYKIIDNAVAGNMKNVNEVLEYFFDRGESPLGVFGLVLYQVRNILKVKILLEEHYTQREIINRTHLSYFIIRKTIPLANKFSLKNLIKLYSEAGKIDLQMKTGQVDPEFGLEYFLLKLAKTT